MLNKERLKYWSFLLSKFLAGQAVVQALNLITGFLVLRFLPIGEYALYTISSVLSAVSGVGSDMGVSQGIVTFGSRLKDDKRRLSGLFAAALRYRRWLYAATGLVVIGLAPFMTKGNNWPALSIITSVLFVLITSWIQQTVSLKNSILNIFHDSTGLMQAGMGSAVVRLALTVLWCRTAPTAVVALAVNLAGFTAGSMLLKKRCRLYVNDAAPPSADQGRVLKEFVYPLAPGVIYYLLQGQISTAILGFVGHTSSVAEVGALGRLGQVFGLFMTVNTFFVQPYFARIENRRAYVEKGLLVLSGIGALSLLTMISAFVLPEWWLFILGAKYAGLKKELPFAVLVPLFLLLSGTLYTMVIARKSTVGQSWMIASGILIQLLFIGMNGIRTTFDALILNVLLAGGGALVQAFLLAKGIYSWR